MQNELPQEIKIITHIKKKIAWPSHCNVEHHQFFNHWRWNVKPPKINLNKTAIWQKCKSLCSLRLHFLCSGHPGNHRPSSFQKPSLRLDIHPEYILVFFITSDMHIECKSAPKMKETSNTWRDTQTGIISSSTYFAVQIFLKYLSEIARIFSYYFCLCNWWHV